MLVFAWLILTGGGVFLGLLLVSRPANVAAMTWGQLSLTWLAINGIVAYLFAVAQVSRWLLK